MSRRTFAEALALSSSTWHPISSKAINCGFRRNISSERWLTRQKKDFGAKQAKLMGYRSRAAMKLLELDQKHKLFKKGMTVVDLGYAPGSWSQVAIDRTTPNGRVIGVDIIPALPPKGVSTFQGNFLDPTVQSSIRNFLSDPSRGRALGRSTSSSSSASSPDNNDEIEIDAAGGRGYVEREREDELLQNTAATATGTVDVVLSDMSEPWEIIDNIWIRSLIAPYRRMVNTSGIPFRDHAGSMDLCESALLFCIDVLKPGGAFVCKFFQGEEEDLLHSKLKLAFDTVHREKPGSSRSESRENYFVGLKMKRNVQKKAIMKLGIAAGITPVGK